MARSIWGAALVVASCNTHLHAELSSGILFKEDFSLAEKAVPGPEGIEAIKYDDGYVVYTSGLFGEALGEVPLRVEIEAASADGCRIGARFLQYDNNGKKLESVGANLWNRSLGPTFQIIKSDVVIEQTDTQNVRVVIYRSNDEGTLFLKSVSVTQRSVVPTEHLVNELKLKLGKQGYQTQRQGEYLVARKTDERSYYRSFPDKMMNAEDFAVSAYIGTTSIKTEYKPELFPIGPYIYGGLLERATSLGITPEQCAEHLAKDVKAHGGNTIYYGTLTATPEVFKMAVAAAVKHGVQVIGQLTRRLCLRPEKGREHYDKVTVPTATRILPQYKGLEGVIAWMPREEAHPRDIDLVAEYRGKVRELDPTHAIYTLHNNIPAFTIDDKNLPEWFGFDRYRFGCHSAHYGILISTPKDMAGRLRRDIGEFYKEAQKRGRPLIFVLQGYGHQNIHTTEDIERWTNGAKDKLDPWSGFKQIEPGVWKGWNRYPPPQDGMHLQCWLAVLEGAKGLLGFHYGPIWYAEEGLSAISLVDEKGKETRLWKEFSECVKEMKPLLPLFLTWHKEALPWAKADDPAIAVSSFIRSFDAERFLVVLNTRIATWDEDSPGLPRGKTELHFDEQGLAGLHPAGPLRFSIQIDGKEPAWDILTGNQLIPGADGQSQLTLGPGRGVVLIQGSREQLQNIRKELDLAEQLGATP